MNILSLELSCKGFLHLIPNAYVTLGKSVYVNLSWLNLELCVKHISKDYKAKFVSLYTPSITLHRYPNSGYRCSLEIYLFGYTYRKGLFRIKDMVAQPFDNTNGFVTSEWFDQFRNQNNFILDFVKGFEDMVNGIKEMMEKEND